MSAPAEHGHAVLSPSGASRWLACTPSARFEQQFPDTAGAAAQEGTLAHELGETILRYHYGIIRKAAYTKKVNEIKANPMYCEDMQNHVDSYVAFVTEKFEEAKSRTPDAVLQIEAKLNLTDYIPEGFGTGDAVIIADGMMEIIDLKYGKGVMVSADENRQMMLYALGALRESDFMYDIKEVRMTVYQPRLDNISSYVIATSMLIEWAYSYLKPRAELAFNGEGEYVAGDHCQFCRARNRCRALAERNLEVAKHDFKVAKELTDDEVADILSKAKDIKSWLSSIEDYALKEATDNGKKWNGYKLVEGRSNRKYANEDEVASTLVTNGFPEDVIYTRSLLGITAMEKAITKKQFNELLDGLVIKPAGKPTLVPESDKRPELNTVESAINDFSNN